MLLKLSELTPHSSLVIGVLCERAGAPRGLVNVLAGAGPTAGQQAISHPETRLMVFVGSAQAMVRRAVDEGGRAATGGNRPKAFPRGYSYAPTVIDNMRHEMEIANEEVFGAAVGITPFSD